MGQAYRCLFAFLTMSLRAVIPRQIIVQNLPSKVKQVSIFGLQLNYDKHLTLKLPILITRKYCTKLFLQIIITISLYFIPLYVKCYVTPGHIYDTTSNNNCNFNSFKVNLSNVYTCILMIKELKQ